MTERELRRWMHWDKLADRWRIRGRDGELHGPFTLAEVFGQSQGGDKTLVLLHESQVEADEPSWVTLELASRLSPEDRDHLVRRKRRRRSRILWQLFGVLLVLGILVGLYLKPRLLDEISREAASTPYLSQEEQMQSLLDKARQNQLAGDRGDAKEALSVMVAKSANILYVTNRGSKDWPGMDAWLNERFRFAGGVNEAVVAGQTIKLSMRLFRDEETGERFVDSGLPVRRVKVRVPGYDDWEERL